MTSRPGRDYYMELRKNPAFGANGFSLEDLRTGMATLREPTIPNVRCLHAQIGDLPGEWVLASNADPNLRLLYIHGGGHVSGSSAFYLAMAAHISLAAGCAVLLPDYRLAPENPFPAALDDCLAVYAWIAANGPSGPVPARSVFIGGDSAGGNLTLALLLDLRDNGLRLPQGGIAISPFADLTLSGDSIRSQAETDPIMHPDALPTFVNLYLGDAEPRNPLASPMFGDYHGIPPLLFQAGEYEIIRDDSVRTAAKAQADGVMVQLEIYQGMFHVFQSHEPLLPEAREAFEHIGEFMRKLAG
ncbi:MAG: alpha/beta hydrolase [Anaerolineae bacterium]